MQTTTNYGFNIVEGTDIVNPLTQLNPNFTALDTDLKAVSDNTVDNATCIKTGTVHAVTRTNTDAKVFRFTATGNWNTGDTMTVDGTLVSVYATDGTAPANGCYVINTEVLATIQGTRVTLYVSSTDANNVSYDNTSSGLTAVNVQDAVDEIDTLVDKKSNKVRTQVLPSSAFTYDSGAKYWYSNQTYTALYGSRDLISMIIIPSYAASSLTAFINASGYICVAGVITTNMTAYDNQNSFEVVITQVKLDTD